MSPRSLLLNAIALVGIVGWMAGAPRLVFGSDAGATIQPAPKVAPPEGPLIPRAPAPPEQVVSEREGGARLILITPEQPAGGGCATPTALNTDPYYIVETQVYDRKTRRPIPNKKTVRRVPVPAGGVSYRWAADSHYAERQFGEWDDGKPLTEAEWRRFRR